MDVSGSNESRNLKKQTDGGTGSDVEPDI